MRSDSPLKTVGPPPETLSKATRASLTQFCSTCRPHPLSHLRNGHSTPPLRSQADQALEVEVPRPRQILLIRLRILLLIIVIVIVIEIVIVMVMVIVIVIVTVTVIVIVTVILIVMVMT